jgi:hypothetical protein
LESGVTDNDPRHRRPLHEAGHTVGVKPPPLPEDGKDSKVRTGRRPAEKRSFNEAAHKLGYWRPESVSDKESES